MGSRADSSVLSEALTVILQPWFTRKSNTAADKPPASESSSAAAQRASLHCFNIMSDSMPSGSSYRTRWVLQLSDNRLSNCRKYTEPCSYKQLSDCSFSVSTCKREQLVRSSFSSDEMPPHSPSGSAARLSHQASFSSCKFSSLSMPVGAHSTRCCIAGGRTGRQRLQTPTVTEPTGTSQLLSAVHSSGEEQ